MKILNHSDPTFFSIGHLRKRLLHLHAQEDRKKIWLAELSNEKTGIENHIIPSKTSMQTKIATSLVFP